jgi:hypothetical protein
MDAVNAGFNMNKATYKTYSIWSDNYFNLQNNCIYSQKCRTKQKQKKVDFEIDKKSKQKAKHPFANIRAQLG